MTDIIWRFAHEHLAGDLETLGYDHFNTQAGMVFVAQLGTGHRVLSVEEFLEICAAIGEEPMKYIHKAK